MVDRQENADQPAMHIDQEVDLLEYLNAILSAKFRILIFAILGAVAVFGASKMVKDRFLASAVLAININENPGGVSPRSYRGSDTLSLLEHDFIVDAAADNEKDRLVARMTSAGFAEIFIRENDLLPVIFAEQWDEQNSVWKAGFEPSIVEAISIFREGMLGVEIVEKTGLMLLHMHSHSAELSARLANSFWPRFNQYIRELQLQELSQRRDYLQNRLDSVTNIEMQRSIFRLMETQLASEALLYARNNYPLEEIQPAAVPRFKSYPNRKSWAVMAFIGLAFLGVFAVLGWVVFGKLRKALAAYQTTSQIDVSTAGDMPKSGRFKSFKMRSTPDTQPSAPASSGQVLDDVLDEWVDKS